MTGFWIIGVSLVVWYLIGVVSMLIACLREPISIRNIIGFALFGPIVTMMLVTVVIVELMDEWGDHPFWIKFNSLLNKKIGKKK